MTDAPERIWLDWRPGLAVTSGPLAQKPRTEYIRADTVAAMVAEDRIKELEAKQQETFQMYVDANEARIDAEAKLSESEALLAKAVGAMDEAWFMLTVPLVNYEPEPEEPGLRRIKSTLAELKGQDDGQAPHAG